MSNCIEQNIFNNCYVEPLPPGPIDRYSSDFHPEHLYISWEKPANKTNVWMYYVTIHEWSSWTGNNAPNKHWPRRLRPGENYTVSIKTRARDCWSYGNCYSKLHQEQITTLSEALLFLLH